MQEMQPGSRAVENEAARREATMKPWDDRIPAAIANAERMLDGGEYLLIPPHIGGNETKLTLVLTAGEVALAKALWERVGHTVCADPECEKPHPLREFTEKIERLNHD